MKVFLYVHFGVVTGSICCFLGNPVLPFILANREKRRKKNRLEKLRKKKKKQAQITKETASGT